MKETYDGAPLFFTPIEIGVKQGNMVNKKIGGIKNEIGR